MQADAIIQQRGLGFTWDTVDPFLLCVHHDDSYPKGNGQLGPDASLAGRDIGQDFAGKDGWRMYHGRSVPGFPSHPHRGFETVTIVRKGFIDHADSLGAAARFGNGDVQWLTAGRGVVHSEMFPLLQTDRTNPLELFQIWLNLPATEKMVEPHFTMFWNEDIPRHVATDPDGGTTEVTVVAGTLGDLTPPAPPPSSWASRPDADLAIWHVVSAAMARWTIPPTRDAATARTLYVFEGSLRIGDHELPASTGVVLAGDEPVEVVGGPNGAEALVLQARPIREPVATYGPFVMNTRAEIEQAFDDYRRMGFGGWPWPTDDPVHPRDAGRFARHADGRLELAARGTVPVAPDPATR